jgi:hypothetical protein
LLKHPDPALGRGDYLTDLYSISTRFFSHKRIYYVIKPKTLSIAPDRKISLKNVLISVFARILRIDRISLSVIYRYSASGTIDSGQKRSGMAETDSEHNLYVLFFVSEFISDSSGL